jgi:hypothetical protein
VYKEIKERYPDFYLTRAYGPPGKTYQYAVMPFTKHEYTLFQIQWGEYFAL